jgi:hypothetical protein
MRMSSLLSGRPTTIERAYELAKAGSCASVFDLKKQLRKEGYTVREFSSAPSLTRTLGKLCAAHFRVAPGQTGTPAE